MSATRRLAAGLAALLLVGLLAGCGGPSFRVEELGLEHPVWTTDGLYLVEQDGPGALFVTPALPKLDDYHSFAIEEIVLGFKEDGPEFGTAEREQAVALVRRHIARRLSALDLQQAQALGPGTLRVRAGITHIDYEPLFVKEGSTAILNPSGGASIMLELRDGRDGRRLFVYAQNVQLPAGNYLGPQHVGAQRVADAFSEYSRQLERYLRQAERGELPGPRTQAKISLEP